MSTGIIPSCKFIHFLDFSSLNLLSCTKPGTGKLRAYRVPTHVPGLLPAPPLVAEARCGLPPTVCGAHKAVTYELSIFSIEFQYKLKYV